ncbi:MAG: hypothetical protein JXQ87_05740 [Bacteroidia bacterium]
MISGSSISQHGANPFPGLRAFKDSESHLFFGREEHIIDVLEKLEQVHFVAVVGTSGTGKSSLIKAGVLPSISKGLGKTIKSKWSVVSTNPGSSPFQNLVNALSKAPTINKGGDKDFAQNLLETLKNNSLGLVQAMRPVIGEGERLLILVDQFEEVFRFADEQSEKRKAYDEFVRLLVDTVRQKDVPIYVILTLRSDFLGDCVAFDGLPEAINDGHYLVPRMNQAQLKRAITGPIEIGAGKISPRLIQNITQNIGQGSDQLPILQHAMMRSWDFWLKNERSGNPIDLFHFESIGGLNQALSNHANEAFNELTAEQQILIEKIFKALTLKKDESRGVRRPLSLSQLSAITGATESDVLDCLHPFRVHSRSFILPEADIMANSDTIFDISHESLMRGWDRLSIWVDEEMESAELYQRICYAAILHQQGAVALWRDPELQLAIEWSEKEKPSEAWAKLYNNNFNIAIQFLNDSVSSNYASKKRAKKRRNLIRLSVLLFIIIISFLAIWGLIQTNLANDKTIEAELRTEESLKQKALAEEAREAAILSSNNAVIAKEKAEENATIAENQRLIAEKQKGIAENQKQLAKQSRDEAVKEREIAKDERNKADIKSLEALIAKKKADSLRISATRLRLLALSEKLAYESELAEPELAGILAIQSYFLSNLNGGETNDAAHYQAASKALKSIDPEYTSKVLTSASQGLAMRINKNKISMFDADGYYNIMSTNSWKFTRTVIPKVASQKIDAAFLSPNLDRLAMGLETNVAITTALNDTFKNDKHRGHNGLVRAILFRPKKDELITGGRDGSLIYWEGEKKRFNILLPARIKSISGNDSSSFCFVACDNGYTYKVNYSSGSFKEFAKAENVRAEVINQTKDGKTVFIGYSNGNVGVYNKFGNKYRELSAIGIISYLEIDAANDILVIGTTSRQIAIYSLQSITGDANTLEQLEDSEVFLEMVTAIERPITLKLTKPIRALGIDSELGNVYAYCSDKTLHRFPSKTVDIINELEELVSRDLTQKEWSSYMGKDIPYGQLTPTKISTQE